MIASNEQRGEMVLTTSASLGELAGALAKAQGAMKPAAKSAENPFFKSSYADLPACWEAARVALSSNNLAVIQTTSMHGPQVLLVTLLAHSSGEWIRGELPVNPTKNDPQSMGSAMTYARRYSFCAITGVTAEDEDDDGNAGSTPPAKQKQQQQQPKNRMNGDGGHESGPSSAMTPTRDYLKEYKRLLKDVGCATAEEGTYIIGLATDSKRTAVDGNALIAREVVLGLEKAGAIEASKLALQAFRQQKENADSDLALASTDGP